MKKIFSMVVVIVLLLARSHACLAAPSSSSYKISTQAIEAGID